jgi:acetyl-CoA synthetase
MAGYLTGDTIVDPAAVGYYRTGDLATRDPDGSFRLIGRKDDVFKSFDVRISPLEGEAILREHPSVRDCVIVPRPHPVGGATSHAIVIPEPVHDTRLVEELSRYCGRRMAPEVAPRSFSFADAFPRTASGKVRRSQLAAELGTKGPGTGLHPGSGHDATSA